MHEIPRTKLKTNINTPMKYAMHFTGQAKTFFNF